MISDGIWLWIEHSISQEKQILFRINIYTKGTEMLPFPIWRYARKQLAFRWQLCLRGMMSYWEFMADYCYWRVGFSQSNLRGEVYVLKYTSNLYCHHDHFIQEDIEEELIFLERKAVRHLQNQSSFLHG